MTPDSPPRHCKCGARCEPEHMQGSCWHKKLVTNAQDKCGPPIPPLKGLPEFGASGDCGIVCQKIVEVCIIGKEAKVIACHGRCALEKGHDASDGHWFNGDLQLPFTGWTKKIDSISVRCVTGSDMKSCTGECCQILEHRLQVGECSQILEHRLRVDQKIGLAPLVIGDRWTRRQNACPY